MSTTELSSLDKDAIENFREYVRIPTVHPNVDYYEAISFIQKQAKELNAPTQIATFVTGKPIAIITFHGTDSSLPAIMLNSHMDVVPVEETEWKHEPFGAEMDADGNIYGRGTQDMKCVGIQYLEAMRRLKKNGVELKRTIYVTFVPDEEIGGADGMEKFVESEIFKEMNVGVGLDESMASERDFCYLFYAEKAIWNFRVHCPGTPGHGASLGENTAAEKVQAVINKFLKFREEEKEKVKTNPINLTKITVLNLTQLKGGLQSNVIPSEYVAVFDCRLPTSVDHAEWETTINQWCKEAGEDVWIEYEVKQAAVPETKIDDSNPYWVAFSAAAKESNVKILPIVCPGSTDAKYLRRAGIPAFGFMPMNKTKLLLHGHDECLNAKTFLSGIEIYYKIIEKLANF